MSVFNLIITSPKGNFFEGEISSANFVTNFGELTILAMHSNITGVIEKSPVKIDQKLIGYAKDGVFTFYNNSLKIIVSKFEKEESKLDESLEDMGEKLKFSSNIKKNFSSDILIEIELLKNLKRLK